MHTECMCMYVLYVFVCVVTYPTVDEEQVEGVQHDLDLDVRNVHILVKC